MHALAPHLRPMPGTRIQGENGRGSNDISGVTSLFSLLKIKHQKFNDMPLTNPFLIWTLQDQ